MNAAFKRIHGAPTLSGATWSPNTISYTGNNRTHMIRIPDRDRFELRLGDGAANPYLLQAAVIAAGFDGIRTQRDPGPRYDNAANACCSDCRLARCGDGLRDTGEQCDDGPRNGHADACPASCHYDRVLVAPTDFSGAEGSSRRRRAPVNRHRSQWLEGARRARRTLVRASCTRATSPTISLPHHVQDRGLGQSDGDTSDPCLQSERGRAPVLDALATAATYRQSLAGPRSAVRAHDARRRFGSGSRPAPGPRWTSTSRGPTTSAQCEQVITKLEACPQLRCTTVTGGPAANTPP